MINNKFLIIVSGISGFLAVSFGAFGAHFLKDNISLEQLSVFQTGVIYHLVHSVAVMVIAIMNNKNFYNASTYFIVGIILFSFSLYVYSVTQVQIFAMITPLGGISFLVGWLLIIVEGVKTKIKS